MRYLCFFLSTVFITLSANAQIDSSRIKEDTLAPYLKYKHVPTFSLLTSDSTWFFSTQIKEKKPTLILYFSPDCGHCQLETEEILAKINRLKDLQIVMITSRPFADMKTFAQKYLIHRFPSIVIGTDPSHRISQFYDVKFTPFSALYNKKAKLVKAYPKGIDMEELVKFLN